MECQPIMTLEQVSITGAVTFKFDREMRVPDFKMWNNPNANVSNPLVLSVIPGEV
jgi:hypothetical protein